jgi:hypothetical protein
MKYIGVRGDLPYKKETGNIFLCFNCNSDFYAVESHGNLNILREFKIIQNKE